MKNKYDKYFNFILDDMIDNTSFYFDDHVRRAFLPDKQSFFYLEQTTKDMDYLSEVITSNFMVTTIRRYIWTVYGVTNYNDIKKVYYEYWDRIKEYIKENDPHYNEDEYFHTY